MKGNWRGQMGYGGSQSNVERWRCEGDVGSFVWTAKGTKDYSWKGKVLGGTEGGDQRRDCEGEKDRGGYSFQSILHSTQSWKQVAQNLGLQKVEQCNSQITFPNDGYNNSQTNNQIWGLCYSTGSREGESSLENERGLAEVHWIQVQMESVLLRQKILLAKLAPFSKSIGNQTHLSQPLEKSRSSIKTTEQITKITIDLKNKRSSRITGIIISISQAQAQTHQFIPYLKIVHHSQECDENDEI
ncbi:MAG: hypothetical protein EZS28_035670 [Streblomastix strix]|uniref:Uncharacterized protein n=1 Tax=Streblomastix strix TaxID=222440 RepID=A0A5J4UF86_9EUKA|nr:MAG: hypothetical protein EZS28_035670 [Streblomastix strix]